jgi:hypothetical protein
VVRAARLVLFAAGRAQVWIVVVWRDDTELRLDTTAAALLLTGSPIFRVVGPLVGTGGLATAGAAASTAVPISIALLVILFLSVASFLFLLGAGRAAIAKCEARHEQTRRAEKAAARDIVGQSPIQAVKPMFDCHMLSFRSVARARSDEQGGACRP